MTEFLGKMALDYTGSVLKKLLLNFHLTHLLLQYNAFEVELAK